MAGLADFRKQYPQYDDIPDQQLADSLHQKFYSDIPKERYYQSLGITTGAAAAPADARTAEDLEAERPARAIRLNGGRRVAMVRDVDQGRDNWDKDTQGEKRAPWTGEGGVLEAAPAMGVAGTRSAVANLRRMTGEESATQRREALGVRMPSAGDVAHAAEEGAEPPKPAQAFDPMTSGETLGGAVTGRVRQVAIDRQRSALQRDEAAVKAAERDVNVAQMDLLNVTPADMNTAQQAVTSLAQSAAPTMVGVAAGILTRNPALAMSIAGGGGSAIQAGSTYGEAREKGASHRLSAMAATIDGVLEGVGEALPLGIALKHGSPIANRIFGTIAAEAGQEAATQAMQDFNAFLTYNPDITLQEAWEGIKVAALTGAMGGSIYGTAGAIADASRQRAMIRDTATDLKTGGAVDSGAADSAQGTPQGSPEATPQGTPQATPDSTTTIQPEDRDLDDANAELNTLAGEVPPDRAMVRDDLESQDDGELNAMQLAMKRAQERAGTRTDPVQAETTEDVEAAGANVNTQPTEAQKAAGNYAKGHLKLQGLDITIENPKDSVRSGQDADGNAWEVTLPAAYGYVKRTTGKDGDQVDVYIGPNPASRQVYIIDQVDPKTGRFDEHKVLVGFGDQSDALAAYDQAFSDGSGEARRGAVTPMAMGKFKEWLKKGDTTKAYAYKFVSPAIDALKNDEMLRASIVGMRAGLGAAEQGGRLVIDEVNRDRSPGGGDVLFRNEWVGNQWWFERPDPGLLAPQAQRAIDKALAGERLGEREARFIEYLIERAREFDRQFDADFMESSGYNDLTPAEQKAVDEVVADAIAVLGESTVEDIKERLAIQTESEAEYEARLREELSEAVAAAGNRQATAATAEGETGESAGRGEQDSRAPPESAGGVDGQGDSVSAADTGVADRQRSDQPAVRRGAASEERSDAPPTGQPPDGAATEAVADKTPSKEGVSVSEDTQSDFVPAPGGGIDYGEITPDQAAAMRRQAGKIRLQRGVHNADGTGHGLAHIEANHGKQIKNAGFDSVQDFVAHISSRFNEILQAPQGRQLLVAVTNGRRDVMFVQLEPSADGEFYRVNTAFPASRDYLEKREAGGAKVLWSGSEPRSTATGRQPPYAGGPEDVSGRGAPIARGKSTEPDTTTTPDLELTGETPADLAAKAQAEAARSMADAAKAMKETADAMRESFTLTGSKRAADEAAARGQGDLLAQREEPRPAANKAGEKIEDFGKKIAGARKDYAAEFRERMAEAMETDIASVPLSQSWPEPDYDKLLEGGADPWAVGFAHAARDEVPTKPQSSWRLSNWVAEVRLLRSMTEKVMSGDLNPAEVRKRLELQERLLVVADRAELYTVVGHGRSLKGVRISQGRYGVHNGIPYDPPKIIWTVESKAKKTAMSHWPTEHANGSTREEAIENFKKAWAAPQAEQESKAVDFGIYSRSGENTFFIGKKIGRDVIPLKTGFKKSMDARIWKAENQAELVSLLERFKDVPYERRLTNEPRVGEDHRQGANITPEQFREAFGFRGGQFGNSMPQDERQAHLNEAYDAMMDLAGVLGVPPKALSLNGELGLAFGARGTGGIRAPSAHYEQDVTGQVTDNRVVINLTRKKGAGSLAHEWFHAVDNYFARMQGKKASFVTDDPSGTGLRPEMQNAFRRIMAAIDSTGLPARSRNLDRTRGKPYWATRLEMAARTFESYVIAKLQDQGASNDYLANVVSKEFWDAAAALGIEKENTYPYPDASEIPAIRAAFDEFFRAVETKETVSGVAMFSRANPEELDFAADFVTELAAHDELFRHRVSASSDLGTVFSEVAPTYRFMGEDTRADERAESGADRRFAVVTPQRKVFHVYERGNEVWIDVSRSDPGEGGNFVYAAVLNYAHNAKKVLIGDPAAVSQDAVVRRTVAMLSSALRFGTTRHMRPAAEQTEGNPAVGIAPLEWSSDEAQNLRNLIDTFLQTTYNQNPEIEGIRYDFASRQFVENGTPVTRDRFNELAKTFRDRTGRSGQSSIRRAGLLQSLVRSESGGRPGLLEDVFRRGAEHVSRGMAAYGPEGSGQTVPNLKGVFSRTEAPERGLSVSAIETALRPILDRWQATPDVVILPSIAQAPAAIREQDAAQRSQGASGAPEGMFWGGRVYLFANALPSVDRAQTVLFHEVLGHYGLRGAFGAELDAVLDQLANVRAGQVARKALEYGLDINNPEHRLYAAEEVLAELAQTQPKSTWVQRAVAAIKRFLRSLGLNVPVSDADVVAGYILPARRFVERGSVASAAVGEPAMASRPGPLWRSGMADFIADKAPNSASPGQWVMSLQSWAKQGKFKADELEWSGVKDWLQLQTGKVSRDDVVTFIRENGVKVEETMLGGRKVGGTDAIIDDAKVKLDALGFDVAEFRENEMAGTFEMTYLVRRTDGEEFDANEIVTGDADVPEAVRLQVQRIDDALKEVDTSEADEDGTRYGQYTLPGGENYRELLLTLPVDRESQTGWKATRFSEDTGADYDGWSVVSNQGFRSEIALEDAETAEQAIAIAQRTADSHEITARPKYKSSHWTQPNILAHIRFNERTDAEGKRVLFIEEIQSDWAQQGKRKGFFNKSLRREAEKIIADLGGEKAAMNRATQMERDFQERTGKPAFVNGRGDDFNGPEADEWNRIIGALEELNGTAGNNGIPPAPFVQKTEAWVSLALKRVIRYAAENGFDRVAMVTGRQSADRYDLSKQVSRIDYRRAGDGLFDIDVRDNSGRAVIEETGVTEGRVEELAGKEITKKIKDTAASDDWNTLRGLDLKIGGEGMIAFYDKIVPSVAKDVLRKLGGGRIGEVEIDRTDYGRTGKTDEKAKYAVYGTQPGFDITPAMRESAMRGLPMFSRKQISEATGDANADLKQPHSEFIGDYIGDLSTFKKFAVYPRTIAALEPDFTPVYRTAESQFETRDRYAAELGRMAEKYFDLTQEERGRVDAVLELGRLKGEVLAGKKMSMENTGQTARLSKKGDTVTLTDAEKSAYWGVRKMFDKALTMFRDQALRDFGIPVERLGKDIRGALEKRITEAEPRQKAYLRAALEIFDQIEKARESGYVPFTRWGDVVIVVRDRTGATLWVGKVETGMVERNIPGRRNLESIPSVRNALNEARTRFRGEQVEIKAFNTPERVPLEGDIRMADLDMLAELAQVDNQQWDSVRDQLAKGLQSRGFRKHFLGADSVPGYSADFERAIADYIIGLSGYLSRRQHAERWETGIAAIDKRKPRLIEYAKNYQKYVNDPQEEWVRLRQAGFLFYIAGVPASAFVNMTQVQLLSAPYMTQFIGASRVQAELARAYKDASLMGSVSRGFDLFDPAKAPADVREDLQAAWDEGFFVPLETYELMGKAYNRTPTQRRLQQGIDDGISAVSIAFQGAERINRLVTFIAAHRIARIRGVEGKVDAVLKANPLARDELGVFSPRSFAEWVIDETHFRMGKINRPGLMRGAGAAILQFRGFTLQTLELWTRMMLQNGPEGRAMAAYSLALMFAVAGLWGMPGADDLRNLLERFYKAVVGEDLDLKTKFRELVYRLSGSAMLAQMLSKGVTYPAGLDLSGRIGMGNIAPDSALQVFGIPADLLIGREVRALEMASRGHWQLAMAELLPNFIKNPMQAADWAESGIRSQATGKVAIPAENVTAGDVTQKAIGFTPARISNIREAQWAKTRANRAVDELRSDYYAKLGTTIAAKVRAERAGDVDKAARLEADVKATFKEIAERNQGKAHHEMIIIRAQTLRERVRDELEGTTNRQSRRRQARSRSQEIDAAYGLAQ